MKNYYVSACLFLLISLFGTSQSGWNIFDDSYIHEVRLTFDDSTFWDTLVADYDAVYDVYPPDYSQRKYVLASLIEMDGVFLDSVGFRIKGFSSSYGNSLRKHFKIDFGEFKDWEFEGLRKLNLSNTHSDGIMVRDAIAYELLWSLGIPSPRTSYFKVYLNDEYWGLYLAVEQVDKRFLEENFVLSDGNLYKPLLPCPLNWKGTDWSLYEDTIHLKTNETTLFHNELYDFLELINTASDSEFVANIYSVADFDKFITHMAFDYVIGNSDGPYFHGRNVYYYADLFNQRITPVPWDFNYAFQSADLFFDYPPSPFGDTITRNKLTERIESIPELRTMYLDKVCELTQTLNLDLIEPMLDERIELIGEEILLQPHYSTGIPQSELQFNSTVNGFKSFISNNVSRVNYDLTQAGYTCVLNSKELSETPFVLSPNPAVNTISISGEYDIEVVKIVDSRGAIVLEIDRDQPNFNPSSINCGGFPQGVYFVEVRTAKSCFRLKFEKLH